MRAWCYVLVIVTEWTQFRALEFAHLKKEMAGSVIIDLRNIYNPQEVEACGFIYEGVAAAPELFKFGRGV
jgi:UDPglucose 6-dehydrogenase